MEVNINPLLIVMLLYSFPPCFKNFRYAIELHDELLTPEVLRIKIVEETTLERMTRALSQSVMIIKRFETQKSFHKKRRKKMLHLRRNISNSSAIVVVKSVA